MQAREQKKLNIITAAAKVFARKGFAGTVMADIAVEAKIGKGTLYEYFKSKDELFFSVFEWFAQGLTDGAKVGLKAMTGSAASKLEALTDSVLSAGSEMDDMFALFMEFWAASASAQNKTRFRDSFRDIYNQFRTVIADLIREGIERGDFDPEVDVQASAAVLVGIWDALLLQAWFEEDFDALDTARRFMPVMIGGLTRPGRAETSAGGKED